MQLSPFVFRWDRLCRHNQYHYLVVTANHGSMEVGVFGLTSETTWRLSTTCAERLALPDLPLFPPPRLALPPWLLGPSFGGVEDSRGVSCTPPAAALESKVAGPSRYRDLTSSTFSVERNCSSVAVKVVGHCSCEVAAGGSSFANPVSKLTAGRPMYLRRVTVWLRSTSKTKKSVKLIKERQT